jgi:tetratricopeptide (TPR) repeat protein
MSLNPNKKPPIHPVVRLMIAILLLGNAVFAEDTPHLQPTSAPTNASIIARSHFLKARARFRNETNNPEAGWELGRACFDAADFASNSDERAEIAEIGIAACRKSLAQSNSAPGHYYLGMNFGQLAQTKTLGALKLVDEMEREFSMARAMNEHFDFAGPDRNLGLLYLEAPSFASIGNRSKARLHLRRAGELAPDYPENRLNLIELYLRSSDRNSALRELKALEDIWPKAQQELTGPAWATSWADWSRRLKKAKQKLEETPKALESPRQSE